MTVELNWEKSTLGEDVFFQAFGIVFFRYIELWVTVLQVLVSLMYRGHKIPTVNFSCL
jgi:hypothetical protein